MEDCCFYIYKYIYTYSVDIIVSINSALDIVVNLLAFRFKHDFSRRMKSYLQIFSFSFGVVDIPSGFCFNLA